MKTALKQGAEQHGKIRGCFLVVGVQLLLQAGLRVAEIVNQLRAAGQVVTDQDLARVSPIMHGHVIPNGTYRFSDDEPGRIYAAAS